MTEQKNTEYPIVIQGGMGVGISDWRLARAVALAGQKLNLPVLGVVSGTGVEALLTRRLQDGDPGGHMQRALAAFPSLEIAESILNKYYRHKKPTSSRYLLPPPPYSMFSKNPDIRKETIGLTIAANFVEVWLAKEGHNMPIGINHLEKIQILHLARLYGAMLAGVDWVLEGAGIPSQVPEVLDCLSRNQSASYKINVAGSKEKFEIGFNPDDWGVNLSEIRSKRPGFLAIVSSNALAKKLTTKVSGVDGFVIEGPTAGGHNPNPRNGEEYGEKDLVNLDDIASLGKPFWLAGGYASPEKLKEALRLGAAGIQVGTIFALCEESGLEHSLKRRLIEKAKVNQLHIHTSLTASPTNLRFKIAQMEGTLSEEEIYEQRVRSCQVGYLTVPYMTQDEKIRFRCPAEPVEAYLKAGGKIEDTEGRICLCSGLLATAGYPQVDKRGKAEPPVITLGEDLSFIHQVLNNRDSYSAEDVVRYLFSQT